MTFFCQNWRSFNEPQCFCKSNKMARSGEHGCWLKVSGSACMLPIFAKAPCCLELFWCCRRLSQHGVGEVLIPLRHCWRNAFFCVCVGSGWFCHDWASHCSVFLLSFDGLLVFGFPFLRPPRLLTHATRRAVCTLAGDLGTDPDGWWPSW